MISPFTLSYTGSGTILITSLEYEIFKLRYWKDRNWFLKNALRQEENWTDSVHDHDNKHAAAWAISVRFVWG